MSFDRSPVVSPVIAAAIAVHRTLGPGLLESAYGRAMAVEMTRRKLAFVRERPLALRYEGTDVPNAYRTDFIVEKSVLVEIKSVAWLLPLHSAQLLTYLRLSGVRHGLLINFNVPRLVDGQRSFVNPNAKPTLPTPPTLPTFPEGDPSE